MYLQLFHNKFRCMRVPNTHKMLYRQKLCIHFAVAQSFFIETVFSTVVDIVHFHIIGYVLSYYFNVLGKNLYVTKSFWSSVQLPSYYPRNTDYYMVADWFPS